MPSVTKVPNLLSNFVSAMEEPNSNPTGLSMMALYNQISSDGNRLILTGDGSDEIFLGYDRYKKINKMKLWPKLSPKYLATLGLDINSRNKLGAKLALFLTHEKNWNFWYYWQQIAKDKYLTSFFNNYEKLNTENYNDEFTNTLINQREFLILTMYRDLRIWLSMESNNKLDKVSMAFSMEARSPFQSEKLIGAVYKKIHGGKTDFLGKKLLTDQFTELKKLPVNIDKMGFVSPLGHWLRKNPQMIHDCIKYLKKNFDFDINELNNLVESPQRGDYDRFRFLWSLIVLAYWHEAQIN
jgi:asparagine synthase (glutamine-hydrolysing)